MKHLILIFTGLMLVTACDTEEENVCNDPSGTATITLTNSVSLCFSQTSGCDSDITFSSISNNLFAGGETLGFVDIGEVDCLGEVTTKPTAGFVTQGSAQIGHGYVTKQIDGTYGRFYAKEYLQSTSGGIIGLKINWQYSY
jgi:hypothetical protein